MSHSFIWFRRSVRCALRVFAIRREKAKGLFAEDEQCLRAVAAAIHMVRAGETFYSVCTVAPAHSQGIWSISQRYNPTSRNERSSSALSSAMTRRRARHWPIMDHRLLMADLIETSHPGGGSTALAVGNERLAGNELLERACRCVSIGNSRSRWTGKAASAMFPNHSDPEKKPTSVTRDDRCGTALLIGCARSGQRCVLQDRPMTMAARTIPTASQSRNIAVLAVIPGRCDSIEPSGAQLRTENLEMIRNRRKPISRFPDAQLRI